MSKVKENDTEFSQAVHVMWREAVEDKYAAFDVYKRPNSTKDDKQALVIALERQMAMWDAYEKVASIVTARHDRELAELRGEG